MKTRKGLFLYCTTNEIIALKSHMHANYYFIAKPFEEANDFMKEKEERKLFKKRFNLPNNSISFFCATKKLFKKDDSKFFIKI
jgi:hypothetical protein